jgi:hypothetical protein
MDRRAFIALLCCTALAACAKSGPSESDMRTAMQANVNAFGGHADLMNAVVAPCKSGAITTRDEENSEIDCREVCGSVPGKCDVTVAISDFKKEKCEALAGEDGMYSCTFSMVAKAASPWLNNMIHGGDTPGTPEGGIVRAAHFKRAADGWKVVAE